MRIGAALVFAVAALSLTSVGCGDAEREARLAAMSPRGRAIQQVLDLRCIRCHTPPNHEGELILTEPIHLLSLIDNTRIFDDIAVYNMLMGDSTITEHEREEFRLTQKEVDNVREWVLSEHREILPDTTTATIADTTG